MKHYLVLELRPRQERPVIGSVPEADKMGQGHLVGGHLFPRVSGAGDLGPRWCMLHTEGQNRSVQVARFGSGLA